MRAILTAIAAMAAMVSCGNVSTGSAETSAASTEAAATEDSVRAELFDADSAFSYVARQVAFGPRVPNTDAHRLAGDWMADELRRHGAEVSEQIADLKAFDGTTLRMRNIFGQYNPEESERLLLVAHYDCRPWADQDPDPAKRGKPVDGANDGASGVAVLLETARQLGIEDPGKGVDILFVDAEDWGTDGDDESWAMGARYFVNNPIKPGYSPSRVIVLDMVGGRDAVFPHEYFSQQAAPEMAAAFRAKASSLGYGHLFPNRMGGAVTDDHVEFIKAGIQAIDIIDYRAEGGFCPTWHTSDDTIDNIDRRTLKAVGETLMRFITGK